MLRLLRLSFVMLVILCGPSLAAEESEVLVVSPRAGTKFESFTLWKKVQLGATTLVNPKTAENALVIYAYDPSVLNALGVSNKLTIAKELSEGTYETVSAAELAATLKALERGESVPAGYKILSTKKFDGASGQAVISWPSKESVFEGGFR